MLADKVEPIEVFMSRWNLIYLPIETKKTEFLSLAVTSFQGFRPFSSATRHPRPADECSGC